MASKFTAADERFMRLALAEAKRGLGRTRPNPAVGAVVAKGGKLIAVGHHRKAGQPHAEIEALSAAGSAAKGATLYVTLEPCCHTGRTGPCANAVIAAGIKRVVVGCKDQNPLVNGRGLQRLKHAGIEVAHGCLEQDCQALNRAFFCWVRHGRPLVTLKFASTLDGIIGDAPNGKRKPGVAWISGVAAQKHAHELRALHHAILVGRGTVATDDPQLTVRAPRLPKGGSREILRVVLDSHLQTAPTCRLLRERADGPAPLFVAAVPRGGKAAKQQQRQAAIEAAGAQVLLLPPETPGSPPALAQVLSALAQNQVQSLLVEGGSRVLAAFVNAGLVDRVVAYIAPKLAGGGVGIATGAGRGLAQSLPLCNLSTARLGQDLVITADVG